jgi:hypothetical protein
MVFGRAGVRAVGWSTGRKRDAAQPEMGRRRQQAVQARNAMLMIREKLGQPAAPAWIRSVSGGY